MTAWEKACSNFEKQAGFWECNGATYSQEANSPSRVILAIYTGVNATVAVGEYNKTKKKSN